MRWCDLEPAPRTATAVPALMRRPAGGFRKANSREAKNDTTGGETLKTSSGQMAAGRPARAIAGLSVANAVRSKNGTP